MNMLKTRYNEVRGRLIRIHHSLTHNAYGVWVAPKTMMSTEEIRNRETTVMDEQIPDEDYYITPQLRELKVGHLLELLENLTSPSEIGFRNSHQTVIPLYESIQEYLQLWCEIITSAPEFGHPPKTELRRLESLAYILFPTYREIKPFLLNQEHRDRGKIDKELESQGLLSLTALFSMNQYNSGKNNDISFVSFLDKLDHMSHESFDGSPSYEAPTFFPQAVSAPMDSIGSFNEPSTPLADWIFTGN